MVVIFPEGILVRCTFAGFGSPKGFGAKECKMYIAKADLSRSDIFFVDLTTRVSREFRAVRSLKIAEFDQRDRRVCAAAEMAYPRDEGIHQGLAVLLGNLLGWRGVRGVGA